MTQRVGVALWSQRDHDAVRSRIEAGAAYAVGNPCDRRRSEVARSAPIGEHDRGASDRRQVEHVTKEAPQWKDADFDF